MKSRYEFLLSQQEEIHRFNLQEQAERHAFSKTFLLWQLCFHLSLLFAAAILFWIVNQ